MNLTRSVHLPKQKRTNHTRPGQGVGLGMGYPNDSSSTKFLWDGKGIGRSMIVCTYVCLWRFFSPLVCLDFYLCLLLANELADYLQGGIFVSCLWGGMDGWHMPICLKDGRKGIGGGLLGDG